MTDLIPDEFTPHIVSIAKHGIWEEAIKAVQRARLCKDDLPMIGDDSYVDWAEQHLQEVKDSWQIKLEFPNGYGASIITGNIFYSHPEHPFELGVLKHGELDYQNPVANGDVVGYLSVEELKAHLRAIMSFPDAESPKTD